jgi:hypothetical protein
MSEAARADMQRSRDDDVVVEPGEDEDSQHDVEDALAAREARRCRRARRCCSG